MTWASSWVITQSFPRFPWQRSFLLQDEKLTKEEILDNWNMFVGSQATNYGEDLTKNHDELWCRLTVTWQTVIGFLLLSRMVATIVLFTAVVFPPPPPPKQVYHLRLGLKLSLTQYLLGNSHRYSFRRFLSKHIKILVNFKALWRYLAKTGLFSFIHEI